MPSNPSNSEKVLAGRKGAHLSWARTADPAARTAPARAAMLDRFDREVDPDGTLPVAERARRAEHARRAYFTDLALKSARSRRRAREHLAVARTAEAALARSTTSSSGTSGGAA